MYACLLIWFCQRSIKHFKAVKRWWGKNWRHCHLPSLQMRQIFPVILGSIKQWQKSVCICRLAVVTSDAFLEVRTANIGFLGYWFKILACIAAGVVCKGTGLFMEWQNLAIEDSEHLDCEENGDETSKILTCKARCYGFTAYCHGFAAYMNNTTASYAGY